MKKLAYLIAATVALSPVTSSAMFLENRASWLRLSEGEKYSYAMGAFDGWLVVDSGDKEATARSFGLIDCTKELGITNADMAKIITDGYAKDIATWNKAPIGILMGEMTRACKPQIDASRRNYGLPVKP
jgi:hypothetical protein